MDLGILKNMTLLYVDDDAFARNAGKILFSEFFKSVDVAEDAKDAMNKLKEKTYDIVITDIVMPEISGFELARYIKLNFPDIIVVFLSSFFDTSTLLKAIEIGVDGFLIKPFNEKNFLQTMENILKYRFELKKHQNLLNQYKDIVDKNLIVSKTDKNGIITYVNDAFEKISGFKKEELIGKPHSIVKHPDMKEEVFKDLWETITKGKTWHGLIKNRKKNGESYYVESVIQPIFNTNGEIEEYIALRKDVTNYMTAEKLINDKLQVINNAMLILVKILNIHDMKLVFDEEVISKFRRRLTKMIRRHLNKYFNDIEEYVVKEDIIGFLIADYMDKVNDIESIMHEVIKKVVNKELIVQGFEIFPLIKMSIAYGSRDLYTNAMLGIEEIEGSEELLVIANGLCEEKKEEVIKNMKILKTIEYALNKNKVVSYFQPIYDNKSKKVVKFESLVRIIDEDGNVLTPFFFLDIAKKAGLYGRITLKVLENCFEVYNEYKIPISINLSPSDILRDFIRERIYQFLKEANIKKGDITFELLEDEIIKYPHIMFEFFEEVSKLNANIAIDDFGNGYSNFTRVIDAKADILKLDGSLIKGIDKDIKKQNIVESIVYFAKKENIKTVAEFVEDENILNTIKDLGVSCSQGYYFSPPVSKEEISKFLDFMV